MAEDDAQVLAQLTRASAFDIKIEQRDAWLAQMSVLRQALRCVAEGWIAFEFTVPRVGHRIDVLVLLQHVIFVLEFKVGDKQFTAAAREQVWDYALDLKNFHSTSHDKCIAPMVVVTQAPAQRTRVVPELDRDGLFRPLLVPGAELDGAFKTVLAAVPGVPIDAQQWAQGRYTPTPTIVEAAKALYAGHGVETISRNDASAINLSRTSAAVEAVIRQARETRSKALCLVTGVPGAGKTLVGLNIATRHFDRNSDLYSVFLSGNDPLVAVLREALARDKVQRVAAEGRRATKAEARSEVKAFIQNVRHFRDDCLAAPAPPLERVALFDEAQRAWNASQTAAFMQRKRDRAGFTMSEPEFLLSCMDRHPDWSVVVCLVGGGQEINTGEAGIGEWLAAVRRSFPHWQVHVSPRLHDSEYAAGQALLLLEGHSRVHTNPDLHLAVSMRSFRAENVSAWVKHILDGEAEAARALTTHLERRYPLVLTRDLKAAKHWLCGQARGSERYGLVVSSQAQRLKPHAIDVRVQTDPVHWFLDPKEDVRSSYYLEDVATEFQVQGLELDWAGVVWDGDLRCDPKGGWQHWQFRGDKWQRVRAPDRQNYLKNAYRVLLTRARQGMVIVVPQGDTADPTRAPAFYDATYAYLKDLGLPIL